MVTTGTKFTVDGSKVVHIHARLFYSLSLASSSFSELRNLFQRRLRPSFGFAQPGLFFPYEITLPYFHFRVYLYSVRLAL